jgi:transcriptional regulator with XRE-family HTH domain
VAISENRKNEVQRQWFFEDTQLASDVLRRRIREYRIHRGMSQKTLAERMSEVGLPLDDTMVSKIERGVRGVEYDELLGFAYVFDVPLAELIAPMRGEQPIRAGGIGLEDYEVANWLVYGPWWGRRATHARRIIRLTKEVQTMCQVVLEERNQAQRREYRHVLERVMKELSAAAGIRPEIMRRRAYRPDSSRHHR